MVLRQAPVGESLHRALGFCSRAIPFVVENCMPFAKQLLAFYLLGPRRYEHLIGHQVTIYPESLNMTWVL